MKMNKKGIALGEMPNVIMILIVAGAFFVAGFLAIAGMQDGVACATGFTLNGDNLCAEDVNASNTVAPTNSGAATITVTTALSNTTDQLGTVGTLIGVGLLLAVVGGAFVIGKRFV